MADGGGYGAGLFDEKGPENFAKAIAKISDSLKGVTKSFGDFGTKAESTLSGIGGAIDGLTNRMQNLQTNLQGAVNVTAMGPGPTAAPTGPGQTGAATPGQQMSMDNAPSPTGGPTVQPPAPSMTPSSPASTGSFPQQQQGTASLGQRAMESMVPATIGAAGRYAQGLSATAIQGVTIGQIMAPAFGVSSRSLYQQPAGTLSMGPQDFAQANYYAMTQMGMAPGTQNWSTIQGQANKLMELQPGLQRTQAFQMQNAQLSPQRLNLGMMFGFNFSPGGKVQTGTQQYNQLYNRLTQTMGPKPSGQDIEAALRPGAAWNKNLTDLGMDQTELASFTQYALTRAGAPSGKLPNGGTSLSGTRLENNPAFAQLQRQSATSQVQQQAEPALAQASQYLNEAATKLLQFANPLASLFGGGGAGGIAGSVMSTAGTLGMGALGLKLGKGLLGKVTGGQMGGGGGLLSKVGGLFRGGAGAGAAAGGEDAAVGGAVGGAETVGLGLDATGVGLPIGLGIGAAALAGGTAYHFRHQIGHALGSVGHFFGGLFGGGSAGAAEPGGGIAGASRKPAHAALLDKPPTNSLLACLTNPVRKTDNTLISNLIFGVTGPGATGGPRSTGGGGKGKGAAAPTSDTAGMSRVNAMDLSGLFMAGAGFENIFASSSGSSTSSTSSGGGGGGAPNTSINPPAAGGDYNQSSWASALLQAINAPASSANVSSLVKWENREGGNWNNKAKYNPLNTSQIMPGSTNFNTGQPGSGIQAYTSWQQGLQATAMTLTNGRYGDLLSALQGGKGLVGSYTGLGTWSDAAHGGYTSLARGSQLVARTQLALLHRGEAVVPAADNYSAAPYNRGGAAGGSSTHLNFGPGSVVLQVPAGASQSDMDDLANRFVNAIAKPNIIAGVRSR